MQEIAKQFGKELQSLLDRYKNRLTTPQIMRVAQPIFKKTIGFKDNPERFRGLGYAKGFPIVDEFHEGKWKSEEEVQNKIYNGPTPMRTQKEVAKALKERRKLNNSDSSSQGYELNARCLQGPDGCCATYKNGWDNCIGCMNFHRGN